MCLFTEGILTCHRSKSTGVSNNNSNYGSVAFKYASSHANQLAMDLEDLSGI